MLWREYANEGEAQTAASKLRKIGMAARVERVEPEFGTSRRAFLIYAFACNLISAERVVERIAAEIEKEAER
jgi:hypothetical protein